MRLIEEIGDAPSEPEGPSAAATGAVKETLAKRAVPGQTPLNDGLDRDWCEPKGLTDAETQQMARLREKYASLGIGRGVVPDAAGDADADAAATEARLRDAQARMDAEFLARPTAAASTTGPSEGRASKIRVCEACRGERVIKREYNHRIMERMCETCDGEGVTTIGGDVGNGEKDARSRDDDDDATKTRSRADVFAPGDGQRRRLAVLHRDAQRIEAQIERYRGEMRSTQERLDVDLEIPAGEEQALAEFAHQLQKHVAALRARADAKRAEAAALRGLEDGDDGDDGDDLERDAEDLP